MVQEFIVNFPGGYDTNVGDRGGQVSGGQKQRLSVARAILMQPRTNLLGDVSGDMQPESIYTWYIMVYIWYKNGLWHYDSVV